MMRCELCRSDELDDLRYGKMITKQRVSVHTYCLYLSSNLLQRGSEKSGIYGFLIPDIVAESRRGMALKCCYCGKRGATIGCCRKSCPKSFHLGCGLTNGALNQFVGTYKSFCHRHVPPMTLEPADNEMCVICLEQLMNKSGFDRTQMLHSPCCNNGWYHKCCLQHYANTSGYFFKCPLCNNGTIFRDVLLWGIWVPNADAEWEKEPNAFVELLERDTVCVAEKCLNKYGRKGAINELVHCSCCGSKPMHLACFTAGDNYICEICNSVFKESATTLTERVGNEPTNNVNDDVHDDVDIDGDQLESEVFKAHTTTNFTVRRPCALLSDDSDSDDPLENWDLFKENSRNIINVCCTETAKVKEQAKIEKEYQQTEVSSNRQPLTVSTPSTQMTRNESQHQVVQRTGFNMNLAQDKKDDNDISCIGRRVHRRRCSITNNNRQSSERRHCTARNANPFSDSDEENEAIALKPTQPKRHRTSLNHNNLNLSCIASRVRQRHSESSINEENSNSACSSSTNSSPLPYEENSRCSDFLSKFMKGLTEAAINSAIDNTHSIGNNQDISCIGVRVRRRRIQSIQLDGEDSLSSGRGGLRRPKDN